MTEQQHIVAYVGSRNPNSRTLQAVNLVREALDAIEDLDVRWTILTPHDVRVLPVDGTAREFFTGVDHVERSGQDDSARLKQLLEDCDYVMFGSPTYGHNVSGDLKNVMDRLTYWGHLYHLAGKPGMAFVSATTNGFTKVGALVEGFMETLGIVVGATAYNTTNDVFDEDAAAEVAEEVADALRARKAGQVLAPSASQRAAFGQYQQLYAARTAENYETRYWRDHGMFECSTLDEYFARVAATPALRAMSAPLE